MHGRVSDDDRGARIGLGLLEGLEALVHVGPHGHGGDVDVAVAHRHPAQVLLGGFLAGRGELGHRPGRRRFGRLPARVGVDLGVEDEQVDVAVHGQDVIQSAVADVVGPAVSADAPDALFHQEILELIDLGQRGLGRTRSLEGLGQGRDDGFRRGLGLAAGPCPDGFHLRQASVRAGVVPAARAASIEARRRRRLASTASRMPKPYSALSSKSELPQAGPRPSSLTQ